MSFHMRTAVSGRCRRRRPIAVTAAVLALLAPPVGATAATEPSDALLAPPVGATAVTEPSDLVADTCEKLRVTTWSNSSWYPAGKKTLEITVAGIVKGIAKISGRPGLGQLGNLFGSGSSTLLDFAKNKCGMSTLLPAVQSLPYLTPDYKTSYPSRQVYDNTVFPPPIDTDEKVADSTAIGFNTSGAAGITRQGVLDLADELCAQATRLGTPEVALSSHLGRADLRAVTTVKSFMSLTLKRCPDLSTEQADDLAGQLNSFLISNQHLADTPPFLLNPSWHCGAAPGQISLTWKPFAVNRITQYNLYHSADGNTWSPIPLSGSVVNEIVVSRVDQGRQYYALRATDVQGNDSAWTYVRAYVEQCPTV
ncbi:hypothetical protein [Streptomyces sp. NPDC093598]|uniref:hypothetical protein n=1 Tax=Streptomyces sp. NPDC093598 TaxID=3366046 RepID=UPI0037FA7E49